MKKIATATIATAGIATFGLAHHDAEAAENNGYNPNDSQSYSYTYTIDQQGNYHYDWKGNWNPSQAQQGGQQNSGNQAVNNTQSNNNYNYNYSYNNAQATTNTNSNNNTQSYTANNSNNNGGGLGASYSTSDRNVKVTTQHAPTTQSSTKAFAGKSSSGANLYTAGQCTYYVYGKVGSIGNTWGNANNWANAAAQAGYSVNNTPKAGAVMQTSQGAYGHVAYVENVNNDGSVEVSEMNYNGGPGVVSTRTISASQASSYNYIS
ncbi:CHAP domain-containing protein [Staphylococcus caledonicus]|uniref:CHAP domain-containing protein n=1 Tax=Staphylococcus caledonicus TaxID=2741333 RepID=UPI0018E49618|nr:CHAP domain-containing protein [Staphylococcus caledonicus]MBI5973027.1 CHAP domain-containing protein [Staphylococcus caledonicus]